MANDGKRKSGWRAERKQQSAKPGHSGSPQMNFCHSSHALPKHATRLCRPVSNNVAKSVLHQYDKIPDKLNSRKMKGRPERS